MKNLPIDLNLKLTETLRSTSQDKSLWRPWISIEAGHTKCGISQSKIIKLPVVASKKEAWKIAKKTFLRTTGADSFSIDEVQS